MTQKQKLVIFSGAGMSAESGISTFRDTGGLWEKFKVEDVATPQAWTADPEKVQHFYNQRRKQILDASPNSAHLQTAEFEKYYETTVITQNVDDLHERAGSSQVLHLHGNIRQAKSSGPNQERKLYPIEGWELSLTDTCDEGFPLRPNVVWFGEEVPMLETAAKIISKTDIFIVIGTSLNVYPAAGLIHAAKNDS
ncbi:MAG: Sir2 family NAD-dependent protein deacetylase, partial [Crocinitomicaceae bacterium]|nr:Sir2 family NAD-dependent protein deacetylase [Crocinitomicaceae bacterium]